MVDQMTSASQNVEPSIWFITLNDTHHETTQNESSKIYSFTVESGGVDGVNNEQFDSWTCNISFDELCYFHERLKEEKSKASKKTSLPSFPTQRTPFGSFFGTSPAQQSKFLAERQKKMESYFLSLSRSIELNSLPFVREFFSQHAEQQRKQNRENEKKQVPKASNVNNNNNNKLHMRQTVPPSDGHYPYHQHLFLQQHPPPQPKWSPHVPVVQHSPSSPRFLPPNVPIIYNNNSHVKMGILPRVPPSIRLPSTLTIENDDQFEEVFVDSVVDQIRENIQHFLIIHELVFAEPSSEESLLTLLEDSRESLHREVNVLIESKRLMTKFLKTPQVLTENRLINYFTACSIDIERAIEWETNFESLVMMRIQLLQNSENRPTTHSSNDPEALSKRVSQYEESASDLVLQFTEKMGNVEDQEKIVRLLQDLEKKIKIDNSFIQSNVELKNSSLSSRLSRVLEFIEKNKVTINKKLSPEDQVEEYEKQMFTFIGETSNPDNTEDTILELRNRILSLMKQVAVYKGTLKKIEDESDNKQHFDYLIDKLEDLQENMANLEHSLNSKFCQPDALRKSKKLENALHLQHERHDTELFGL